MTGREQTVGQASRMDAVQAPIIPVIGALRPVQLGIAIVAAVLLLRFRWSVLRTLGVCALLGLAAGLAGLPLT